MPVSEQPARRATDAASRPRKALTIGAVCKILQYEFDDVSISKIRYLEDQNSSTRAAPRVATALQPGRRRAPADDPPPAARRVSATAGDPPGVGRRRQPRPRRQWLRVREAPAAGAVRRAILVDTARSFLSLDEVIGRPGPAKSWSPGSRRTTASPAGETRGQNRLRRDRSRDRPRRQRTLPGRRRRSQPARLPLLRRSREGRTSWKRCWGRRFARATPSAARRRCKPGKPGGDGQPPQAPPAGARPAPARRRLAGVG